MVRSRRPWRQREVQYVLQLTAMVDMFTILLVFLLKSYSTSSVQLAYTDGLVLPISTAVVEPKEAVKLVVTTMGIYVEDEKVLDLQAGQLMSGDKDPKDDKFIKGLYEALDDHAKKARDIASQNTTYEFKGDIIVQADQSLNYHMIKSVMYTSMLAGYANIKLGTMGME